MPRERNPSYTMTVEAVDNVVDRLLRGKYEKRMPATPVEVIRAGFINSGICHDYVASRWARQWNGDRVEGTLSPAGVTMRSNKLWERVSPMLNRYQLSENDELVWRVHDYRTNDTLCYAPGSRESARRWAWTLFGWTLPEGSTVDGLRTELASGGGFVVASTLNMKLVDRLHERIKSLEDDARQKMERADRLRTAIDAVTGAAAHLVGGGSLG